MAKNALESLLIEYKDTNNQLNKTVASQAETIANMTETIATMTETITTLEDTIKNLNEKIDYLTKKLFGKSSEKSKDNPEQEKLFDEAEQEATAPESPADEEVTVKEHSRKKKRTHEDLFSGVPQRDEIIPLSEEQRRCASCGSELEIVGLEYVRREFRFTPAKGEIVNIYRQTAKCPVCAKQSDTLDAISFVKAEDPEPVIPHSYTSTSAVAWTMYQKYVNALPLYRQEADWKNLGVTFNRTTLANWMIYCSSNYFVQLYEYFHRQLLKRQFLMADETRVQVLKEPGRAAQTDSFMWLFRSGEDGEPTIILYKYTQTRAKFNAAEFLDGFQGYLETDGYQGYNNLPGVKRCCCWAHLRRYFIDAIPKGKQQDYSEPAVQAVQYVNRLFEFERLAKQKQLDYDKLREYRLTKEAPILEAFWLWLDAQHPRKGSRFANAVNYAQNQKEYLMTYLEDGRCSFSNNLSENAIRPFTVGRKNWLFSDTPKGADASATIYTMVEMAKAHDLNVYKYLNYLLERLPRTSTRDDALEKLAPWTAEVKEVCSGPM